ncbi:LysR family transcriptional regulator [Serratia oryzae]|uniref:LysR family transcriptional regulator n=2 Tax=Serratia oryzae TaxID=2034155 RepID=A0A1S8CJU3_9GAMM|nr:LysR family transcriptional regulator [Serratia oryzae]OMQ23038.1 LysR family transcriptional regulator [Serratia oryzae]VXC65925.1 LysR family transcriptional regulator [Enterobacterales bacterium 8AC]
MDIGQLEAFVVLSECLSVTRAAEQLYCTQPAVSIRIKKLEETLNTPLFERLNNRLHLTSQGVVYREYALQILNLLKQSREHMRQFDNPDSGTVNVGASHFCGVWLLPRIMADFKKTFPGVNIRLDISTTEKLSRKLAAHETDFIIISDYIDIDTKKYRLVNFLSDSFVLICPPDHWLAARQECSIREIQDETFLIKPAFSATRSFLLENLRRAGVEPERLRLVEIGSLEGIKQGVVYGLGISVVSRLAVEQEIRSGQIREIKLKEPLFLRGISYAHHRDKLLSPAAQNFLARLPALKS